VQVSDEEEVWTAVAQLLRAQLTESVWFSTFQDVTPVLADDHCVVVRVPSTFARDRIYTRYLPIITDAMRELGLGDRDFEVEIGGSDSTDVVDGRNDLRPDRVDDGDVAGHRPDDGYVAGDRRGAMTAVRTLDGLDMSALDEAGLNPRYTFDTFVKGASNQFALAAALRVAETPGRSYNPLFIYGSAGLGKTHLLHAIGHYVHRNYQHHEVRYVSTETFMNEYVDAIRSNSMSLLRRRYRDVDVLLIDDVQFLEGKEGLQEEFFHTFNSLHGTNKQIVISSDRMPDAIPTLEERLRGRFKWGLITDIQPPDLETRLAILRNKSERDRVPVPPETLEFIASHITSNIHDRARAAATRRPAHRHHATAAHRRRAPRRDGGDPRLRRRRAARQEPSASARDGPADRDVRVPRPHRSQLPEHRTALRRPRPHHRDPRRGEDPAPDG
jgi:chromosomal replication initiator protein